MIAQFTFVYKVLWCKRKFTQNNFEPPAEDKKLADQHSIPQSVDVAVKFAYVVVTTCKIINDGIDASCIAYPVFRQFAHENEQKLYRAGRYA